MHPKEVALIFGGAVVALGFGVGAASVAVAPVGRALALASPERAPKLAAMPATRPPEIEVDSAAWVTNVPAPTVDPIPAQRKRPRPVSIEAANTQETAPVIEAADSDEGLASDDGGPEYPAPPPSGPTYPDDPQ